MGSPVWGLAEGSPGPGALTLGLWWEGRAPPWFTGLHVGVLGDSSFPGASAHSPVLKVSATPTATRRWRPLVFFLNLAVAGDRGWVPVLLGGGRRRGRWTQLPVGDAPPPPPPQVQSHPPPGSLPAAVPARPVGAPRTAPHPTPSPGAQLKPESSTSCVQSPGCVQSCPSASQRDSQPALHGLALAGMGRGLGTSGL